MKHFDSFDWLLLFICLAALVGLFCSESYGQGIERWNVKSLKDGFIPGASAQATIHEIHQLKLGTKWSERLSRQSVERNVFSVRGKIVAFGRESDSDLHVVVSDGKETIVCEVPKPEYANPKYTKQFSEARSWLISKCGKPGTIKRLKTPIPCTVTGCMFVDRPHGFNAPSGFELHPAWNFR